jgi:hypothetical protein
LKLLEDWLCHLETKVDCQRNVVVNNEEEFQHEEQLDEARIVPSQGETEELKKFNLLEEIAGKQLNNEAEELMCLGKCSRAHCMKKDNKWISWIG